jgi:hypothetical protein
MTSPANQDTAMTHTAYQPTPYNFSRPHPPSGSVSSSHSGHTLNSAINGEHIGVNGVTGPKSLDGIAGLPLHPAKMSAVTTMNGAERLDKEIRNLPNGGRETARSLTNTVVSTDAGDESYGNGTVMRPLSASNQRASSISVPAKPMEHLFPSKTQTSPTRFSPPISPIGATSPIGGSNTNLQPYPTGSLRQRHSLQVPKAQTSRTSTPASGSDAVSSGRFSPTSSTPRRASLTLGRRPTRSLHSDNHLEEIPPDEDAAKWAEAIKAKRASKRRKEEIEDDKVVVGTKVDHNHVNWVTAYNMLTGIRFCVSRINAKMVRPLTDVDFDAKHKFSFDM